MGLKKLALMTFLTLSISACQTRIDIVEACGIGTQYEPIKLNLNSNSDAKEYQGALVYRKEEINRLNRKSKQEEICVKSIQRYRK